MKDAIRVVLVDPTDETRDPLIGVLDRLKGVWLAEVSPAYQVAASRVADLAPHVAIVVLDADPKRADELIRTISQQLPNVAVLAAGHSHASPTIFSAIRAGAREFLALPTGVHELVEAIGRLTSPPGEPAPTPEPESASNVIAITGPAGEVGCTSLAVNLATTLAKASADEVVLADFDLLFGSVDALLDLKPENTLADIVKSLDRIDHTLLKRMLTRHSSGLYVLPRPSELMDAARLDAETLRKLLKLLKATFPTVVIDTSKNVQASDFVAFESADVILIVLQLESTCVRNTGRLLECFNHFENLSGRCRLVANRVGSSKATVPVETAELALQAQIPWRIPNATKVFHAARDKGVPIDAISTRSDAARAVGELARALGRSSVADAVKPRRGFFRERS